jgi:hypothetical protein
MAERTGTFISTPAPASISAQATNESLKHEYKDLFLQREDIQARMRAIEETLGAAEYEALIRRIENPQPAVLKLHLSRADI